MIGDLTLTDRGRGLWSAMQMVLDMGFPNGEHPCTDDDQDREGDGFAQGRYALNHPGTESAKGKGWAVVV